MSDSGTDVSGIGACDWLALTSLHYARTRTDHLINTTTKLSPASKQLTKIA